MDAVVEDALREVARAEAALADAEARLREAWGQRLGALREAGLTVLYVSDSYPAPLTQRLVVEDPGTGKTIDVDRLTAEAIAG
jgi:outer membrane protein TolC